MVVSCILSHRDRLGDSAIFYSIPDRIRMLTFAFSRVSTKSDITTTDSGNCNLRPTRRRWLFCVPSWGRPLNLPNRSEDSPADSRNSEKRGIFVKTKGFMRIMAAGAGALLTVGSPIVIGAASLRAMVQQAYEMQCRYIVAGDLLGYAGTLSPDFVSIDVNGMRTTEKRILAGLRKAPVRVRRCKTTINKLVWRRNVITVFIRQDISGMVQLPKREAVMNVISSDRDTWRLRANHLMETSTRAIKSSMFIDAKPVARVI